ncbi:MAG: hypothetical protein KQH79_12125 [Bacteroidetes bacterium]|nr:hypothetical protein [Bacteroidota bacterium]
MKIIYTLVLLLCIQISVNSQNAINNLNENFKKQSLEQPLDQVFIHLDRNQYYPGDTIRFQAYIRDRQTCVFETQSLSLYAMIVNNNYETIDSARFRISNSVSSGWLTIPNSINTGNYKIVAFTSLMMNYNPEFSFRTPIRITKRRSNIQNSNSTTKSQVLYAKTLIDLKFLPEGGTFVYGIPQRLAFNAVEASGKTLNIKGVIVNQNDKPITKFCSGKYGPGIIKFTPVPGEKYYAVIEEGDRSSEKKWSLPEPNKVGVALKVDQYKNQLNIDIYENGMKNSKYTLCVSMNNALILSKEFKIDSVFSLNVNTKNLPAGTAFITLLDPNLNPIAERLTFINSYKRLYVGIESVKFLNKGEETELTINVTDENGEEPTSIISLAVIDSTLGYYKGFPIPDIESVFLYDPTFFNNLPSRIKLQGLSNIDKHDIDILFLTYGWRKFNLTKCNQSNTKNSIKDYEYFVIKNRKKRRKERTSFNLLSFEGSETYSIPIDDNKEARLYYNSLDQRVRQMLILPDEDPKKNKNYVEVMFPGNNKYITEVKKQATFSFSENPDRQHLSSNSVYNYAPINIDLDEITVKAQKPRYKNSHTELFATSNIRAYSGKDITGISLEDALSSFNLYKLDRFEKKVILRQSRSLSNDDIPATFVLDGFSVGDSYEPIDYLNVADIESISILKGSRGYTLYGASGGIIFIDTKFHAGIQTKKVYSERKDDLMRRIELFRSEIEYYIPTKEEIKSLPHFQNRPTVLWLNEIYVNNGMAKIRYPNNLYKGKAIITVNGVSLNNRIGSARYSYKVE